MLHEYYIIYNICYYLWFHVTTVGVGMYYPYKWWHYCMLFGVLLVTVDLWNIEVASLLRVMLCLDDRLLVLGRIVVHSSSWWVSSRSVDFFTLQHYSTTILWNVKKPLTQRESVTSQKTWNSKANVVDTHSFHSLSCDRTITSSKTSSPHLLIVWYKCFLSFC
jgi:hypothetical protein